MESLDEERLQSSEKLDDSNVAETSQTTSGTMSHIELQSVAERKSFAGEVIQLKDFLLSEMSFESILTFPFYLSGPAQAKFKLVPLEMFAESPPTTLNTDNDMEKLHETSMETKTSLRRNVPRESILNHDIFSSGDLYLHSQQHRNIIAIIGSAGSGKTCLLKMMLSQSCIETLYDFVFFIQCQYIDFSVETNLLHFLAGTLPYQWICDEDVCAGVLKTVADSEKVLILIDGYDGGLSQSDSVFDSVTSETNTAFAKSFIESILSQTILSKAKIVVSARSSSFFDLEEPLRSYPAIEISGLSSAAQEELCKNVCSSTASKVFEFIKFYPSLQAWCVTPETCTAVVHVTDKFLQQQTKEVLDPSDLLLLRVAIASWALLLKSKNVSLEYHDVEKFAFAAWNQVTKGKMHLKDADLPVGRCFNGVSALVKVDIVCEKHHTEYVRSFYNLWAEILAALYFVFFMKFKDCKNSIENLFLNAGNSSSCFVVYYICGLSEKVTQKYMKKILAPFHFPFEKLELLKNGIKNETKKLTQNDKRLPFLRCLAQAKLDSELAGYIGSLLDEFMLDKTKSPIYETGLLYAQHYYQLRSEIETLRQVYCQCRLLFVCPSCFNLEPPVLVELCQTSSTCSWCLKDWNDRELLLLEQRRDNDVEYIVVRKCMLQSDALKIEKNSMDLICKSCSNVKNCKDPHNHVELRIWILETQYELSRTDLVELFQSSTKQECDFDTDLSESLKGDFHCKVCLKNFREEEFGKHRDSFLHKKLTKLYKSNTFQYRPVPSTEKVTMCQSKGVCENGDLCLQAHSAAELKEWKLRLQLQKDKSRCSDADQISFVDSILNELKTISSSAFVWKDSLPGIKVRIRNSRSQRLVFAPNKPATYKWRLKIHCNDHTEKLNHAAFYATAGGPDAFGICCFRRRKYSRLTKHMNFKVSLNDSNSLNLFGGDGTYEVRFEAKIYGSFSSCLFLEFRNSPRPVLVKKFDVEVSDSLAKYSGEAYVNSIVNLKVLSWESRRKIIRWDEDENDSFSMNLRAINNQYKPPSADINFKAKKRETFPENQLDIFNYVEEMHNFLHKEEEARSKHLKSPRLFVVAFSKNYESARMGIVNCRANQLFAIFELPSSLSRDTDEGLLILESCKKVLIGRRKDTSSSPVFEALIEEKFVDHVVILLSKECVTAWKLECGKILKAEIQFQLDRDRFCRCHWAIDHLKDSNQLGLVCPNRFTYQSALLPNHNMNSEESSLGLDEFQLKVLSFLRSETSGITGETIPLLVVEGSFGTGKTFTIGKCIKYLLEHDQTAKILICTHSNSAANLYIENNFTDVDTWKSKVLRVVFHGRRISTMSPLVMRYCSVQNGRFRYPTARDIASHQVIITTFETALSLGSLGTKLEGLFTHIFLDEVAQVMEPVAVIPLTLAISGKTKIVIAGDHKQMTEKIYCIDDAFDLYDADFTLLSRMYKLYSAMHDSASNNNQLTHSAAKNDSQHLSSCLVEFRNNYRCVIPVLKLIQLLFYTEDVTILKSCATVKPLPRFPPIQFHDVEGRCEMNQLTGDYYNEAEASYIKDLVKNLFETYRNDLKREDVVVLASYRDQVIVIREKLRSVGYQNVPVHSVRDIQGLEYKIVILSCVHKRKARRNTDGENYGFLSDRSMLNTAFARSKLGIIAVGHAVTLLTLGKCDVTWRYFIEVCFQCYGLFNRKSIESTIMEATRNEFLVLNPFAHEFVPGYKALQSSYSKEKDTQSQNSYSLAEDDIQVDEAVDDHQEETLPLQDDILDDIVRSVVGIKPENLIIKVDSSGVEYAAEKTEQDEGFDEVDYDSLDHLNLLVANSPDEYKKCTLHIKTWYSAVAVLHEPERELDKIQINTKRNLGRSFDQDEVVVQIAKRNEKELADGTRNITANGKVVGTISRHRDPHDRKFICFPDPLNPGLMCPVDKKITKFVISGKGKGKNNFQIPIREMKKDKSGEETPQTVRNVKYNRHSMNAQKDKHFIVRFIKWTANSLYPVGYVSEEIKPTDYEKYYSLLYDVPDIKHDTVSNDVISPIFLVITSQNFKQILKIFVERDAKKLMKQPLSKPRRDLENLFVFTIDPEGSTDLDDAINVEKCSDHNDCWEIGIHIADVASVIPADSDVDLEARKRGTSFYSGEFHSNNNSKSKKEKERKVIHMLPSRLSSKKCSLLPDGQKRPTISIFIHSTKLPVITPTGNREADGELNLPTPELTYVRSRRQLTYKEAEDALRQVREHGVQDFTDSNENKLADQLFIIWKTMLSLRFQRKSWGSFQQQPDFNKFNQFFDEISAHMLIEEAMITCNSCCSHYLQKQECDFLLRIQNPPLSDESSKWREENMRFINLSLYQQECVQHLHGEEEVEKLLESAPPMSTNIPVFPQVLMKINEALRRNDLETALILFSSDVMQPALSPGNSSYLSIQNRAELQLKSLVCKTSAPGAVTHCALRLPLYSWFTSPIRRYTDLHSQRMILRKISSAKQSPSDVPLIEISLPLPSELKDLSKKLNQRYGDAKNYERDVRCFSFALSLTRSQNYETANISQADESGVELNFLELRDMSTDAFRLRYSDLKLHTQTKENISWKIRYYDVGSEQASTADDSNSALHSFCTSTVVSFIKWNELLRSAKHLAFDSDDPMNEYAREALKFKFERLLKSQKRTPVCSRSSTRRSGPCDNQDCRRKKVCRDYLDGQSKLGICHFRVITMPLTLGTPLLTQLHCGVKGGICVPSIQLLSVAQDLDICASHNRQPVETFAADVRPVHDQNFGTIERYIGFWLPLLRMDGIYNAVKDNSNCIMLQNVLVTFDDTDSCLKGTFELTEDFCKKRMIGPSVDDFVCIRVKCFSHHANEDDASRRKILKGSFTWVVHGVITKKQNKKNKKLSIYSFTASHHLVLTKPKIPKAVLLKEKQVKALVELIQLGVSHRGIVDSLRSCEKLCKRQNTISTLCLKLPKKQREEDRIEGISHAAQVIRSVGASLVPGMKYVLNEGQISQIKRALRGKITLIQGPPGTGKSFTGAHLAYYFHQCNKSLNQEKPKKILYCGPSNKSVDVVAEYLLNSDLKVLRIYGSTYEDQDFPNPLRPDKTGQETEKKPSRKIRSITLHHIIRKEGKPYASQIRELDNRFLQAHEIDYGSDYVAYKDVVRTAKLQEIEQHDVIICTCTAAAIIKKSLTTRTNKFQVKKAFRFAQCIIDECGMCSEPETLAPIVASQADQVVLIGDHQQLQPIIQCKKAKDFGLAKSLFERKHEESKPLTNQYRMDPGICNFPSESFYESMLETDQSVLDREAKRSFRFCHPAGSGNTAVFCHVESTEQINYSLQRGGESSCYNETEARVAIQISMYFHRNKVPLSNIMILSPYSAQVTTIRDIILKERSLLKDVHVGTVVTSQGSENDFVILSTVRSRPSSAIEEQANVQWRRKFIGFVSDPHQINVAITRAKSGLCIVGNKNLLKKDTETWEKLLKHYEERESIVDFEDPTAPWNLNS